MTPDSNHHVLHSEVSQLFEILCSRHRRLVLLLLRDSAVETTGDLLAHGERYTWFDDIAVRHAHLPKLVDTGYVEWNHTAGLLSKGPSFERIEPFLDLIETRADQIIRSEPDSGVSESETRRTTASTSKAGRDASNCRNLKSDGGAAITQEQRATGCLLGLACGDALGRPVEFKSASTIAEEHGRVTEMLGYGTHNQPAGTVTDDTEMALSIAESLVACAAFDPTDIADRFVDWYDSDPFDIGMMTHQAVQKLKHGRHWTMAGHEVWKASPEGRNAGNGSVMRCAPLALAYPNSSETLIRVSRDSSRITHTDPRCVAGCAVLNLTIAASLRDDPHPLATALEYVDSDVRDELVGALEPVKNREELETLPTSGYVVDTLQTALYDALTATSAEEAIVTAVNRGGDADTIGAVTGAVAGARFGVDDLPERWLTALDERQRIEQLAANLLEVGE